MEEIRLNKYLSEMGVCSRREADRLIDEGKVLVDGEKAVTGMKVTAGQQIVCDGRRVGAAEQEEARGSRAAGKGGSQAQAGAEPDGAALNGAVRPKPVLLAVHKPRGVVCTTSQKDRALNIVEMVNYPTRVYPVGRLDKDSEGLIFLTNQGDLVNRIMRGSSGHEKEYAVTVNKPVTAAFINGMKAGVWLEELKEQTRPCEAWITGKREFHIVLTQGLNRQIRRMCGAFGYQVQKLVRIRIMNVCLGNLKEGTFRKITGEEYETLLGMLEPSASPRHRDAASAEKEKCDGDHKGCRTAEAKRSVHTRGRGLK